MCAGLAIGPGLPVPAQEVQNLLTSSPGLNLGSDFLPGALGFDRADLIRGGKPQPADLARLHATPML